MGFKSWPQVGLFLRLNIAVRSKLIFKFLLLKSIWFYSNQNTKHYWDKTLLVWELNFRIFSHWNHGFSNLL